MHSKFVEQESYELNRLAVNIQVGSIVQQGNDVFRITQLLDFDSVIATNVETGRSAPLRVRELKSIVDIQVAPVTVDTSDIADEDWTVAEKRFAVIEPLTKANSPGRKEVELRAAECDVNTATIYRWLKRYNAYGSVSALIPKRRGWKEGNKRIDVSSESVIDEVIEKFFLTTQRPTAQKAVLEVRRICLDRKIEPPSSSTIRARINNISERERLRKRGYREKASNKFLPVPGKFPNADYPLAVVQIDHTPADIILVDDVYRKPIGRPWITLAMDVCTRMVTGYYLSFDPPSETSVAMCVAHSMIPKEEWLLLHNVDGEWPVWGTPNTIHVDNGADFRSNNFQQSCHMYGGIHLEFRPVKQPRYGGHIERLLGTLLKEIHDLPGTTFSSISEKDEYDAEKHAAMTKSEFEEWLVTLICKVYHKRKHSGIGISPLKKWEIGIFGNAEVEGVGMPARPTNRHTVLLDFLPAFRRTVQTFGVTIDGMTYYAEALRPWINASEPDNKSQKRQLVFRRDPRDISYIWFYDPDLIQYFKIPLADQSMPPLSIWECNQAKEALRKDGTRFTSEHELLRAITELRTKVSESQERTKKARRQAQRRKEHEKNITPAAPLASLINPLTELASLSDLLSGDIDAFGDVE
jgi:putative transposase